MTLSDWHKKMGNEFWVVLSAGILLLFFSWYVLFIDIHLLTTTWGAPWDTALVRPPIGDWQRTLNDFFEVGIGSYLPTILFFTLHLFLLKQAIQKSRQWHKLAFFFAITNFGVVALLLQTTIIVDSTFQFTLQNSVDRGYFKREGLLILVGLIEFSALLLLQRWYPNYLQQQENKE